jgi:hypothetical protein
MRETRAKGSLIKQREWVKPICQGKYHSQREDNKVFLILVFGIQARSMNGRYDWKIEDWSHFPENCQQM